MGRQINFHMDEDTEQVFIEEILKTGLMLCDSDDANTKPKTITSLPGPTECRDKMQLYLYKPQFGDLVTRTLPDGRMYTDPICSPVIQYS